MLLSRERCVRELIKRYYGSGFREEAISCETMCPSCRGESSKVVNRIFLIDHMESEVFMNGSVLLAKLSLRLLEREGAVWVAKSTDIKAPDSHELIILLWVHEIICVHWDDNTRKNNTTAKTKKTSHYSFAKKPDGSNIRMTHRDDNCWLHIPHV